MNLYPRNTKSRNLAKALGNNNITINSILGGGEADIEPFIKNCHY